MEPYSINELGGLITVCAGALATVLFAVQKSSCTRIRFCGCECLRDPNLIKKAQNDGVTPRPPKKDKIDSTKDELSQKEKEKLTLELT
jgi:hypothetical protein